MIPQHHLPADIERTSLSIITAELEALGLTPPPEHEAVVKRVIHTTADFDYARNLRFTPGAVAAGVKALRAGTPIITDTNMALAGITKPGLARLGGTALCYMADPEVAALAKAGGTTRAVASMQRAAQEHPGAVLAVGNAPAKAHIFIQSMVPQLTELSFYYMNLVTVSRLQRNPTVKSEIQMRNFETSIPVGFFTYPISQAADITAFGATTVPAGEDQMPMLEQCREIVHKFNAVYGETLTMPEIMLPQNAACLRLPGTDGKAKMSKSLGNCIYLSDEPEDIKKKIMSMYTDPNHLRVQDPGKVEGNPVFIYLDAFCRPEHFAEFWPEYQNLDEVKAHYQRGGLGDVKVKKFLNSVMQAELEPIRNRRKEWEQRLPEVVEILKEGSAVAEKTAAATLAEVRKSMKIDYFTDDNLLK